MKKIYLAVSDCGDGSSAILFFQDHSVALEVINSDKFCEELSCNEGSLYTIEVHDDFTPPYGVWDDKDYILRMTDEDRSRRI